MRLICTTTSSARAPGRATEIVQFVAQREDIGRRLPHGRRGRGGEQVEETAMPALRLIEARTGFGPHPGFSTL